MDEQPASHGLTVIPLLSFSLIKVPAPVPGMETHILITDWM